MDAPATPRPHPRSQGFVWRDLPATDLRCLTPGQMGQFNELGFVRLESLFSPETIAAVTAAIDPLEAAHERHVRERRGGRYFLTRAGTITFSIHLVKVSPALAEFARHPAIKAVCGDLIGPDVRLYWDQAVYKKTEKAQEFPWHQDNGYTFVEPQHYLTLWIPLVDVDEENGCPWVAPRLHRRGTLEHWLTDIGRVCLETAPEAIAVPARAGDAIVFSSLTPHRTGPNLRAGSVRKAYILQYAPEGAHAVLPDGAELLQDDAERQFSILEGGR